MILLAIDCAASLCAACVWDSDAGRELGREVRDLGKGHAEHLMEVIGLALERAGKAYADLGRIAVSIGPGSFTGVRVGVATARGLALALKVPAVGVTTLEALAAAVREAVDGAGTVMAAIDGGRDGLYVAVYDRFGTACHTPLIMASEEAAMLASRNDSLLAGSAAERIAALMEAPRLAGVDGATADIAVYARLAAVREPGKAAPVPLYLREPDAKPQTGFALPRRS